MSTAGTDAARAPVKLTARALSHRYGARVALEPVEFEWSSPGVVAVTGANGSILSQEK